MRKYKNVSISNQDGFLWGFNVEFVHQINNINFDNCSYCFADMFSLEMAPSFMWFWCILVSFLQKLKVFIKMVGGSFLPVSPTLIMNAFVEVHMKLRVILIDWFDPKKLSTLWLKGQVLHHVCTHMKNPDWLSISTNSTIFQGFHWDFKLLGK